MNKLRLLKAVNLMLFISFLMQCISSVIIFFRIKVPHTQAIFEFHEYNGLAMITLAAIHIILNWGWIRANFLKSVKKPANRPL